MELMVQVRETDACQPTHRCVDDHGSGSEANKAGSGSFTSWDSIGQSIWKVLWESSGQVRGWPCPLFLVEKTGCPCRHQHHLAGGWWGWVIVKSFNSWILPSLTLKYFNKWGLRWRNLFKKPPQIIQASSLGLRTFHALAFFFFCRWEHWVLERRLCMCLRTPRSPADLGSECKSSCY